jgi:hypothetical protein
VCVCVCVCVCLIVGGGSSYRILIHKARKTEDVPFARGTLA